MLSIAEAQELRRALDIPASIGTRPPSTDAVSWQHVGENKDISPFWFGCAIAAHPAGGALLAKAAPTILRCVGLARIGARVGNSELVQWEGVFEMDDWTRVAGSPLLVCSALYYLGTAPGTLTISAPCVPGQLVQRVGHAITSSELQLNLGEPILL